MLLGRAVSVIVEVAHVNTRSTERQVLDRLDRNPSRHHQLVVFVFGALLFQQTCRIGPVAVFIIGAVGVVDRDGRVPAERLHIEIVRNDPLCHDFVTDIQGDLEPVVEHGVVDAEFGGQRLVERALVDTLFVVVGYRSEVIRPGISALQRNIVRLTDGRAGNLPDPVRVALEIVDQVEAGIFFCKPGFQAAEFRGIRIVGGLVEHSVDGDITFVFQRYASRLRTFGVDDNHAVRSARSVDGRCRTILQNIDGFDVLR